MDLKKISLAEAMRAHIAAMEIEIEASKGRPRFAPLPDGAFPAPSLLNWLKFVEAADVPSVPATEVGRFDIPILLSFEEKSEKSDAALAELDRLSRSLNANEMLRWDCCAPLGIKHHMGDGHASCPTGAERTIHPGDPRAFDILYDYTANDIAVLRRPWVNAMVHEGFPVEFRVFVHQGHVRGVSNYYVQRPLPASDAMLTHARACMVATSQILVAMTAAGAFPWMAEHKGASLEEQRRIEATLDFLITPDGKVMFLEAGPGAGLGAHPCCFFNSTTRSMSPIEGIRLSMDGPSLPMGDELHRASHGGQ